MFELATPVGQPRLQQRELLHRPAKRRNSLEAIQIVSLLDSFGERDERIGIGRIEVHGLFERLKRSIGSTKQLLDMGHGDPRVGIGGIISCELAQVRERLLASTGHEVRLRPFVADGRPVGP